ncbi:MAG: GAF domain-containing protein [Anaerolineae bacterium]
MNDNVLHVLLIEDKIAEARLIGKMLSEKQEAVFDLIHRQRLSEGLERLDEGGVQLLLLDLSLPDSRGFETFRQAHEHSPDVPIIVLTGFADEEMALRAVREGAQDYLFKEEVEGSLLRRSVRYALERKRAELALQRRTSELEVMNRISAIVSQSLDLHQILPDALETVLSLDVFDSQANGAVFIETDRSGRLTRFAPRELSPDYPCPLEAPVEGRCLCHLAYQRGEVVTSDELSEEERQLRPCNGSAPSRSICLPLRAHGRTLGGMSIWFPPEQEVTSQNLDLLSAVSDQIGVAVEKARLYKATQRRARHLVALNQAAQAINSSLDLSAVLNLVMNEVRSLLDAMAASVILIDRASDELVFAASVGPESEQLKGVRMPLEAGIVGWVVREMQPVLVSDAQNDPRFYQQVDEITGMETHSMVAVPLVCRGDILGVVEAINVGESEFDEEDVDLLNSLADSAAMAIENARLYEVTRRRLAESNTLQRVMRAAASTLDFDQVVSRILWAIHHALDVKYLCFLNPDETGERLLLHPSFIGFEPLAEHFPGIPLEGSVCGQVYRTGEPVLIRDASEDPRYLDLENPPGMRSELAVPVSVDHHIIGVLNVESERPNAFDKDDLRIFESIAVQLSVVMENARLYEAEREQRKLVAQSRLQLVQNEKLAATGRLAASLAHEINNPLQAIHNSLQMMLTFPLAPEEQRDYLAMADEEVARLIEMVTRILDFARRPQSKMKPTDLNKVVSKVLALSGKYLQHRHIMLHRDLTPDLPPVLANAGELGQVFLNLVLNAVDAMPDGGSLRVGTYENGDKRLMVTVTDTGMGISPENLSRIFEPFFSTKEGGTGLGLTVCHNIVQRHAGEITVESQPGEGSTFTVWLPDLLEGQKALGEQTE